MRRQALLSLSLSLFLSFATHAETESWRPMWLAASPIPEINAVAIVVESVSRDARKAGVSADNLRKTVEFVLRRNKIRIEPDPDFWAPRLVIEVSVLPVKTTSKATVLYVYRVDFTLWTSVGAKLMPRFGNQYVRVELWQTGVTGYAGDVEDVPVAIRRFLNESSDSFSREFLKAEAELIRDANRWAAEITPE